MCTIVMFPTPNFEPIMAENSLIEWTDHTFNPWMGCRHVSAGCANCYMFDDMRRYGRDPAVCMARVGKKAAGRELDGRTWEEMPCRP